MSGGGWFGVHELLWKEGGRERGEEWLISGQLAAFLIPRTNTKKRRARHTAVRSGVFGSFFV